MKKILIFLMLLCTVVCASAASPDFVIDNADLLTDVQEQALNASLADLKSRYGFDIVVLTESSIGSEDPMVLYRNFRGQDPNPDALLRNRGLLK